jgi:hypothetical protein
MRRLLTALTALCLALPTSALAGGGPDMRVRLVQTSHFDGTTGATTQPRIVFHGRNAHGDQAVELAARLAESARFEDARGGTVRALAEVGEATIGSWDFTVLLQPERPLDAGAWYTLDVQKELALVVGTAEGSEAERDGHMRVRFFTGNDPSVRRMVVAVAPEKRSRTIDLMTSEPVELGKLAAAFALTGAEGKPIAGCLAWEGRCVREGANVRTNAFSFLLADGSDAAQLARSAMSIQAFGRVTSTSPESWRPCGRSVDSSCAHLVEGALRK